MDLSDIRRLVIIAMFSDDVLFKQLALKGGNALNLVYRLGSRSSIDVDLSLAEDFEDFDDTRYRIFRALKARFAESGLVVFDEGFSRRPSVSWAARDRWGGYQVEFKLMEAVKYQFTSDDISKARREALVIGPSEHRIFRVQISKYEYCRGKAEVELDDYSVVVYTPEMIAIEKLRAICQQMPEYPLRGYQTARARDFYDIFSIVAGMGMNFGAKENLELVRNIFGAKEVDLKLIPLIGNYREFHRQDWPSVELTTAETLDVFDVYFDFVLEQAHLLQALWEE
jgi:hypothetical protein